MKKFALPLFASLAPFALVGCLFSEDKSSGATDFDNKVNPKSAEVFFNLPSSVTGQASAARMARTADGQAELTDPYVGAMVMIHVANAAKVQVADFVRAFEAQNIPENFETTTEAGVFIKARTIDTTLGAGSQKLVRLQIQDGQNGLQMAYWRNARGQYRGNFVFKNDSGAALVRVNQHNEAVFGSRMEVILHRKPEFLTDTNAPSTVRMVAVKKDGRVLISGASYHPTFKDAFWGEGPHLYGFRIAADSSKDVALVKIAFADQEEAKGGLFQDQNLMDRAIARQALPAFKDSCKTNPWWSASLATSGSTCDDLTDQSVIAWARAYAKANPDQIKTNPWLAWIAIPQPVVFTKGGVYLGGIENRPADAGVVATDLNGAVVADLGLDDVSTLNIDALVNGDLED